MAHDERGNKVTGDRLPKSFSVAMGGSNVIELSREEQEEADALKAERKYKEDQIREETRQHLERIRSQKVTRKLIPWGTKLLVKRRKVEDRSGHIILPDEVKNLSTDIADVVEVPEQTMVDTQLLRNAETIIKELTAKANLGDSGAVEAMFKFKEYLLVMTTKPGDVILLARYGGTDFLIQETNQTLCVTDSNGIYARVVEKKS